MVVVVLTNLRKAVAPDPHVTTTALIPSARVIRPTPPHVANNHAPTPGVVSRLFYSIKLRILQLRKTLNERALLDSGWFQSSWASFRLMTRGLLAQRLKGDVVKDPKTRAIANFAGVQHRAAQRPGTAPGRSCARIRFGGFESKRYTINVP